MHRMLAPLALGLCALAAGPLPGLAAGAAQNVGTSAPPAGSSRLSGTITDPSGALVPGALVVLDGPPGHFEAKADAAGRYSFAKLPAGNYTLSVSAQGFASQTVPNLSLQANQAARQDVAVAIGVEQQEVNVQSGEDEATGENGSAVVLKGNALDALSPDSRQLQQQLQAMAGGDGDSSPQLYVDGFSGGKMPPKSSIREIRINQNPYSAEYEEIGFSRIEIFTKPGTDTWHGDYYSGGTASSLDSKNPFSPLPQPFYSTQNFGDVSGPITKKSSFALNVQHFFTANSAIVDAVALDANGNQTQLTQTIANPSGYTTVAPRFDWQLNGANTLTARYEFDRTAQENTGVGQLLLSSQAYSSTVNMHTLQISDTTVISPKAINELRFQYIRTNSAQAPSSSDPTLVVEGAFTGGGNNIGALSDHADQYELQDYGTLELKKHYLRFGLRQRLHRDANYATAGYNGEYIFPTLTAYQITVQGLAAGLPAAAIRANGGGASQFNISAGQASAAILLADTALFAEDTWKARTNLTLTYGLRFESQNHVADHADVTPRIGVAWQLGTRKNKPPLFTVEGGFGLFYQRLPAEDLLQVARLDGARQVQYVLNQPNDFPALPTAAELSASTPSTAFSFSPRYRSPYSLQAGVSVEHGFGKVGSVTLGYTNSHGVHLLLTRNMNAPLPGTYNPADPTSGVRPLGGQQNLYEYDTSGVSRRNRVYVNGRLTPVKGLMIFTNYSFGWSNADTSGGFPSNQYDIGADYGRAGNDRRQRVFLGGYYEGPWGLSGGPFLIAVTGNPFDIVLGNDLNGDSQFNDRPAFATDLTRPSVVHTSYGVFDTSPMPGQRIIPHNYAPGPGLVNLNLNLNRSFHFGPVLKPAKDAPAPPPLKAGEKPKPPDRRFTLDLGLYSENVLNHVNPAAPVGTLGSPLFGKTNALNGDFSDGSANRIVAFQAFFRF